MKSYKKGQTVKVKVTGTEKYGIFVTVDNKYSGLIHISEVSDGFVKSVDDYVSVGETIYAKIIDIDEDNKQLKLSIKDGNYKSKSKYPRVIQTKLGFQPLKDALEKWIKDKIKNDK